uniref:Uncharacterized protein n=1 Tax=Anguilla anguilla TaxID=7936 RepID=A0A0E9Q8Q4_ANGAN
MGGALVATAPQSTAVATNPVPGDLASYRFSLQPNKAHLIPHLEILFSCSLVESGAPNQG